ncbi:rhomboid family intramembrane serine protease GlpG [Paraglaciecola aestuariivivens]
MNDKSQLIAFSAEQPARLLAHYLISQGIQAEYLFSDNAHLVILSDDKQQDLAQKMAEEFVQNPNHSKYQHTAWESAQGVQLNTPSAISYSSLFKQLKQSPFAASVLVICLITYSLAVFGITGPYLWLHIQPIEQIAQSGQWWRIIGPALIHFSLLHIAFNLLWWWSLGKQIEKTFGLSSLLLLFVYSAAVSNFAQLVVSGPNFGGLSGVVYALVGCVWWLGWLKPKWGVGLPKPVIGFLLIWLVVGYLDILPIHMANTAHTVGLICGCLFAWFLASKDKSSYH